MDNLDTLSREDLYAEATERKIKNRKSKPRDWLISAIREERAKDTVPDTERPGLELTEEERDKIGRAEDIQLSGLLHKPGVPEYLKAAVQAELEKRARVNQAKAKAVPTPVRYEVMKGGKYAIGGRVTQIAAKSILTPATHDLKEVKRQGIVLREFCAPVRIDVDPMWGAKAVIEEQCTESSTAPETSS